MIRRVIMLLITGVVVALTAYSYHRGLRYMPPVFEPEPHSQTAVANEVVFLGIGAYRQSATDGQVRFRAYVPEPSLQVTGTGNFVVQINNLHPQARLDSKVQVQERIEGLRRTVSGEIKERLVLSWQLPQKDYYRFTAIGDTGGGPELRWVLQRSQELDALFLLHLGDFNYETTDFADAESVLNSAAIPTFAAVGNHDFYESWSLVYPRFMDSIGPLNSTFVLGGIRFVNLDTASRIFPVTAGGRNALLVKLQNAGPAPDVRDTVVFTHKPLRDPRDADEPFYEHALTGYESDWLKQKLLGLGFKTLLAGHVHMSAGFDHDGLKTLVSGQGLAHADLMYDKPVARMLIGHVLLGDPVLYQWVPLNMPANAHCNARGLEVLVALDRMEDWRRARQLCADQTRAPG